MYLGVGGQLLGGGGKTFYFCLISVGFHILIRDKRKSQINEYSDLDRIV